MDQIASAVLRAPARLAALRETALVDASVEAAFDRLTRLASATLRAPIALVSLMHGDRQVVKSCCGLPEPWASRRETPLSHSFCQHAVASGEPLVIDDAREHPLVRDTPAIRDLGAVAYAGIPLLTSEGHALGSFCVIDSQARRWTEAEVGILQDLAASVMTEVELRGEMARRRRAEAAASASEETYLRLFRGNPLPMWVYDPQTLAFLDVNDTAIRQYGYSQEEFLSMTLVNIRPPEDVLRLLHSVAMPGGGPGFSRRGEFRHRRKDGTALDVEVYTQEVSFRDRPARLALIHDMTDRKRAEVALRHSEERYRSLVQATTQIVWLTDARGDGLEEQPTWSAFTGQSAEEQRAWGWLNAIHPDDRVRTTQIWQEALENRSDWQLEHRVRRHDGEYRYMSVRAVPVLEADGSIREWVGAVSDVTESRRAEERQQLLVDAGAVLSASLDYKSTLRSVARLMVPAFAEHCAVDLLGDDGQIVRVDLALGVSAEESFAGKLREVTKPDWSSPQPAVQVMRNGESMLAPDVDDAWLSDHSRSAEHREALQRLGIRSVIAVPLIARGHTMGAITFTVGQCGRRFGPQDLATAEEIGRRAAMAIDNAQLYRRSQEAVRAREEILAIVSHELRGPLNVIQTLVDLLLEGRAPDAWGARERPQLKSIQQSTRRMAQLARDLVDITRIESGHFVVRPQSLEVAPFLAEVCSIYRPLAEAASLRLDCDVPDNLPAARADGTRTHQVLAELLDNAIRHSTSGGTITLRVRASEDELLVSVSDGGEGMAPDQVARLLDDDAQAKNRRRGAGFGLAIARGVVEVHGGRIWVESRKGEGTTVHFTLPTAANPQTEASPEIPDEVLEPVVIEGVPERIQARRNARERERMGHLPTAESEWKGILLQKNPALVAEDFVGELRHRIAAAMHLGRLRPGDRLPSIREIHHLLGIPYSSVVKAYDQLEAEGLVEKRDRSGMYLAPQQRLRRELLSDTAIWLAEVLTDAYEQQIKLSHLPELLRRWTSATRLRCACIASDGDQMIALCTEMKQQFGLSPLPISTSLLPIGAPEASIDPDALPTSLREAELVVTTAFHAPSARAVAEALRVPLVVLTVSPEAVAVAERRLREGDLTVVCVDPAFGDQVRSLAGGQYRDRVRVVLADDLDAVATLDPADPVLLTRAAHAQLKDLQLRLLLPLSASFALSGVRDLAEVIIQLNMEASR